MIDIHAKNLTLSEEQYDFVEKKVSKLLHLWKKLQDEATKIRVEIDHDPIREKHKQIFCSITIFVPGTTLRAETHEKTIENSLDTCEEKLRMQIEKSKNKLG